MKSIPEIASVPKILIPKKLKNADKKSKTENIIVMPNRISIFVSFP